MDENRGFEEFATGGYKLKLGYMMLFSQGILRVPGTV